MVKPASSRFFADAFWPTAGLRSLATTVPIEFGPHRPGEQQDSFLNVEKARDAIGWTPKVTLEEGLAKTFAWFEKKTVGTPA